jgi:hypothetical protein
VVWDATVKGFGLLVAERLDHHEEHGFLHMYQTFTLSLKMDANNLLELCPRYVRARFARLRGAVEPPPAPFEIRARQRLAGYRVAPCRALDLPAPKPER